MKDQVGRQIKTYEDFQNHVKDEQLLDGAYEIGVIGWEAHKILKHARDTRHIFDDHPRSSEPSLVKVLSMMDDCRKYVLDVEYPPQIIDLDEYVATLDTTTFDRNNVAIESAVGNLPEIYTKELAHRLFSAYTDAGATTVLRGNIEYVVPILWPLLPRALKLEVARRVDQVIAMGNASATTQSFRFVQLAKSIGQLSLNVRRYSHRTPRQEAEGGTRRLEHRGRLRPGAEVVCGARTARSASRLRMGAHADVCGQHRAQPPVLADGLLREWGGAGHPRDVRFLR
jgi:hypothetical protein